MKKVFFAFLAMSVMSTTALYAEGGKIIKKHHAKKTTCPKGCPNMKDCHKTAICPNVPGCVCG